MSKLLNGPRGMETASDDLVAIAKRHGIECNNGISARMLSERLQAGWLQKGSRLLVQPGPPANEDLELLGRLGMLAKNDALVTAYEGTLLLGAGLQGMRRRLAFVLDQWESGLDTGTVWFLVGQRQAVPEKENLPALCTPGEIPFKDGWQPPAEMPRTETDIAKTICLQSRTPAGMHFEFVDTPLQPDGSGGFRRPNTTETVREFVTRKPNQGMWLVISSQPFMQRQTLNVLEGFADAPAGYNFVEAAPAADPDLPLKTHLDELARLLYQLLQ